MNPDRTYVYRYYIQLHKEDILQEHNEKGVWEIKDYTLYVYVNEENGVETNRTDQMLFDKISEKKASRTVAKEGFPDIKMSGKKVSMIGYFDSNSADDILNGDGGFKTY